MRKIYMSSNEEDLAVAMFHGLSMAKSSGVTRFFLASVHENLSIQGKH